MRILLASCGGIGCWFMLRLMREGHDCQWFEIEPEPRHANVLNGLIPPPIEDPDFASYDLVIFDATGNGELAEEVSKVTPVIGDSLLASKLEDDRLFGIQTMEQCGIEVPAYETFDTPDEAKAFLLENPKRYVFKPFVMDGEEQECDTTYVSENAEDLVRCIDSLWADSKNAPFLLQEVVEGTEISTEGYFDGTYFHFLNHTIEEKKFMSGGFGPNTGCSGNLVWAIAKANRLCEEGILKLAPFLKASDYRGMIDLNTIVNENHAYGLEFCYSEDTEVLTDSGWRLMRDVQPGDIVAGMDDDKNLVFVPVEETTRLRWNKPIMHIKSGNCYDLMVTPNHNMCLLDKRGNLTSKPACKMSAHGERTIRTAKWGGLDVPTYTIPAHLEKHVLGRHKKTMDILHPAITLPMEAWCRFLGIFIAEGHLHFCGHETPYQVNVTQHVKVSDCRKILEDCHFKYTYDGHHLTINSVQLAVHLRVLIGDEKCYGKRMPRFILDLAPKYIEAFLDGHRIGDGSIHKRTGQRTFHSSSKGLAEDISEALLRIGVWCRITKTPPNGKSYAVRDMYHVNERRVKMDGRIFPKRHCKYVPYEGHVVCLTVPYHRLYVRRPNGPAMWCANTPRFGYDASASIFSLLDGDLGNFFFEIINAPMEGWVDHNPVPKLRGTWAASERLTIPPYPEENADYAKNMPIKGVDLDWVWLNCYLWDVQLKGEDLVTVGINGIVCCPIACGHTPEGAWRGVERVSKGIKFPNLQCRDDLEDSTLKRLKECQEMGWLS